MANLKVGFLCYNRNMEKKMNIPRYVQEILEKLEKAGFEAYIVGGCVRNLLLSKTVKDWDITTKARPEEILKIFVNGKYENKFGTVLVPIKDKEDKTEDVVEITTYRSEQGYSDRRHPDQVRFENSLEKDLERRDFTINAMAIQISDFRFQISDLQDAIIRHKVEIVDLFGGRKDLGKKLSGR